MTMMIQISGDYGEPKADDLFWPLQKKLNDCFNKYMVGNYFNTLTMLAIVFRVSGKVLDFGSEGPERMKYVKNDSKITIDLVFSESSWRGVDNYSIRKHVSDEVKRTVQVMFEKAESLGEIKETDCIEKDFEKAISEFLDS